MRVTISDIKEMKTRGEKVSMITAYDYTSAGIVDSAGIPMILVGDSLAQVMLGYDSTLPVTMNEMIHHTKAVARGAKHALIVGDMPFMSYQASASEALRNAGRFLQEGGAQTVKLEGGVAVADTVHRMVSSGIPVMGHIGLTPQSVNQLGGYKVQGKTLKAAVRLMEDARSLEEAGAFALVLECVPSSLAGLISLRLSIPTIGIGAGNECDGQVQVFHDMLGLLTDFIPKHAKRYANLGEAIANAVAEYMSEVKDQSFPSPEHGYQLKEEVLAELQAQVR
jgi:3-methyl-2-oxobutanoate hydroxymethyltransferase